MTKEEKTKWKADILERLSIIRRLVDDSEHCLRTAKISYKQYRRDLEWACEELDKLEEEIKSVKGRSILDLWFNDPLGAIENNFDTEVHEVIEDIWNSSQS